jgi:PTH2 family peptidyl-tRNA hydrolase
VLTALILDSGVTEFGGVPTNTAVAVGPDQVGKVDAITGGLPLL